ncbi:MAG TPA: ImmA/IrrE family metallo-endopeptidase [Bdellovibrionales bacterium]|nr:ImmA/IrrE family metallo-endopeptidase [Bdellovibrionales bacterium]
MIDGRRKKIISKTAESLLEKHGFFRPGFDADLLVRALGIELQCVDEMENSISGFSVSAENKRVIGIRSTEFESKRGRFTLAHELGHLMLHQNSVINYSRAEVFFRHNNGIGKNDPREYEANFFAACLLMPEQLVTAEVDKLLFPEIGLSGCEVEGLAETFNVSSAAMTVRLSQLGYSLF